MQKVDGLGLVFISDKPPVAFLSLSVMGSGELVTVNPTSPFVIEDVCVWEDFAVLVESCLALCLRNRVSVVRISGVSLFAPALTVLAVETAGLFFTVVSTVCWMIFGVSVGLLVETAALLAAISWLIDENGDALVAATSTNVEGLGFVATWDVSVVSSAVVRGEHLLGRVNRCPLTAGTK